MHLHNNSHAAILHNNNNIKDEYLGDINWGDVWRALNDIEYSGTFNLEVKLPRYLPSMWNKRFASISKLIVNEYLV